MSVKDPRTLPDILGAKSLLLGPPSSWAGNIAEALAASHVKRGGNLVMLAAHQSLLDERRQTAAAMVRNYALPPENISVESAPAERSEIRLFSSYSDKNDLAFLDLSSRMAAFTEFDPWLPLVGLRCQLLVAAHYGPAPNPNLKIPGFDVIYRVAPGSGLKATLTRITPALETPIEFVGEDHAQFIKWNLKEKEIA